MRKFYIGFNFRDYPFSIARGIENPKEAYKLAIKLKKLNISPKITYGNDKKSSKEVSLKKLENHVFSGTKLEEEVEEMDPFDMNRWEANVADCIRRGIENPGPPLDV